MTKKKGFIQSMSQRKKPIKNFKEFKKLGQEIKQLKETTVKEINFGR